MTIAAAYLTHEGLVLGSDSATTFTIGENRHFCNHAQKIFEVGEKGNLGVCTWGAGGLDGISHRSLIARLGKELKPEWSVQEAVEHFVEIIKEQYTDDFGDLGYFIGGCLGDKCKAEGFAIYFSAGAKPSIIPLDVGFPYVQGCPDVYERLILGYVWELRQKLQVKYKISDKDFNELSQDYSGFPISLMPVREAVDFVFFLVYSTIKSYQYRIGIPFCGGAVEVAVITTDRPFRWVHHKRFNSAISVPVEGGGTA